MTFQIKIGEKKQKGRAWETFHRGIKLHHGEVSPGSRNENLLENTTLRLYGKRESDNKRWAGTENSNLDKGG